MKLKFVVSDFESSYEGRIHSICLIPVHVEGTKCTRGKGVLIYIRETMKNESTQLHQNTQKKVLSDLFSAATYNMEVVYVNFFDAVKYVIDFVVSHGNILMSHNLISDLDFLVKTQNFVKGKRIVKNYLKEYPKTGMYDGRWSNIQLICSMSLITNRATKFIEKYKIHPGTVTTYNGMYSFKLESFSQFVKNNTMYKQSHTAIQDTIDLVDILKHVFAVDGDKTLIDQYDYLVMPTFSRAIC